MNLVRKNRILQGIDIAASVGLELGPLTAPVVEKSEGQIYYLDHLSFEQLRDKYKDEPVNLDEIVPIDYVLKDNSLLKTVGRKKFDYVVASHVIEHIPNTVMWFKDIAAILKPGGVLSLAIPDMRYTFDLRRQATRPSDIVGAYLDNVTKFTSSSMYDFASSYADGIDSGKAWEGQYDEKPLKYRWSKREAFDIALENLKPDIYIDSHCYTFTPGSFLLILRDLTELKLLDFELVNALETQEGELEFYVTLKKVDARDFDVKRALKKLRLPKPVNQLKILEEQNRILQEELLSITTSQSWRLTQPLRSINKIRKRPPSVQ